MTMMNQTQSRTSKISPILIAFIIDQYLYENNFSGTRSIFLKEATSLINHSSIKEVPKNLMGLGEMLDEYVSLKEQKVMLDQQREVMMQEGNRVQIMLQGMKNVIDAYNALPNVAVMNANAAMSPQSGLSNMAHPGVSTITTPVAAMQNTSNILSLPNPVKTNVQIGNFSTPMINASDKRKDTQAMNVPIVAKKPRGRPPGRKIPVQGQNTRLPPSSYGFNNQVVFQPSFANQSLVGNCAPNESEVQGLSVPRTHSSEGDTCASPTDIPLVTTCNGEAVPTYNAVIPTNKAATAQKMASIESNHCNFPINIDVDKSLSSEVSTSKSDKEFNPNLLDSEMDFSFSKTFSDLGILCDIDFLDHPAPTHSKDDPSRSSHECNGNQVKLPTPAEVLKKDMNIQGLDI